MNWMMKKRIELVQHLLCYNPQIFTQRAIFLTGLTNPIEIFYQNYTGIVGVDSTCASVCGSKGVVFDKVRGSIRLDERLDFNAKYNTKQLQDIRKNIEVTKFWVNWQG